MHNIAINIFFPPLDRDIQLLGDSGDAKNVLKGYNGLWAKKSSICSVYNYLSFCECGYDNDGAGR